MYSTFMKKYSFACLMLISGFIITGCASSYTPIDPMRINYGNKLTESNVDFSYQYDILRARGNKKYAKKEDKTGIRVVAIRITNNSGSDLLLGENYDIYSSDRKVVPLDPGFVSPKLKQGVAIYLLYLPLTFAKFTTYKIDSRGYQEINSIPIGYALGPGITLGNMAVAGTANTKLQAELVYHNLIGRKIANGETVHGIVALQDFGFNPLSIKLKANE
jgi:hypothetical protein